MMALGEFYTFYKKNLTTKKVQKAHKKIKTKTLFNAHKKYYLQYSFITAARFYHYHNPFASMIFFFKSITKQITTKTTKSLDGCIPQWSNG